MIFAAAIGWIMFSELPDLWTWIGAAVILRRRIISSIAKAAPDGRNRQRSNPHNACDHCHKRCMIDDRAPTTAATPSGPMRRGQSFIRCHRAWYRDVSHLLDMSALIADEHVLERMTETRRRVVERIQLRLTPRS